MRRFSWFCLLVIMFKLCLGTAMAMPAMVPTHHPSEQTLSLPACHGEAKTGHAQHPQGAVDAAQSTSDPATHTPSATDADCHHCCALGLGSLHQGFGPTAPSVQATRIQPDWRSVSLRPGLRPPIL
ncbi:hypothetical protein [Limnohabitans sp. G3-2]|uniref:hypothetical protein n=1 Tax=Limnohabitans sp. G3-2 TaxID=1100711 RepID=UPI000C1EB191|nr:hypothetical protein [Limnohabitans sp. G3-2]PIT74109.1 hypothetical protein B9Z31_09715 [Limnohabitans sp. G3-2]